MRRVVEKLGSWVASPFSSHYSSYLSVRARGQKGVLLGNSSTLFADPRRRAGRLVLEAAVCESKIPRAVALTFDDGPTPEITGKILSVLKQYNALATFFVIGNKIAAAPELLKRATEEGHRVGNHTFSHPRLSELNTRELLDEIRRTNDLITETINKPIRWFRPPYGDLRTEQEKHIVKRGSQIAYWSVNSKDWRHPGVREIVAKVKRELHPGAVIVMHDVHPQTVEALPFILDEIAARGWKSLTLSEMFPRNHQQKPVAS